MREILCLRLPLNKWKFKLLRFIASTRLLQHYLSIKRMLLEASEQFVHVNQDTRLKNRVLDLRTPANQGIFCIQYKVEKALTLKWSEVMYNVDHLFVAMFDHLNEKCQKELEAVGKQFRFEPLKYLQNTLRLTFQEGVQMLKVKEFQFHKSYFWSGTKIKVWLGKVEGLCLLFGASKWVIFSLKLCSLCLWSDISHLLYFLFIYSWHVGKRRKRSSSNNSTNQQSGRNEISMNESTPIPKYPIKQFI